MKTEVTKLQKDAPAEQKQNPPKKRKSAANEMIRI
jgi:hypothetical protein